MDSIIQIFSFKFESKVSLMQSKDYISSTQKEDDPFYQFLIESNSIGVGKQLDQLYIRVSKLEGKVLYHEQQLKEDIRAHKKKRDELIELMKDRSAVLKKESLELYKNTIGKALKFENE